MSNYSLEKICLKAYSVFYAKENHEKEKVVYYIDSTRLSIVKIDSLKQI